MKLSIIGSGVFGCFLGQILRPYFDIVEYADSVILAVPFSAYDDVASKHAGKHLINVCSTQKESTDICLKYSDSVTSVHPLFGPRTPEDKRYSIVTHLFTKDNDTWFSQNELEQKFLNNFSNVSHITKWDNNGVNFTPESHDILMAKTHLQAVIAAKQAKVLTDRVKDVPDNLIPHSFRKLREFVASIEDCPAGTLESILANKYG